MALTDKGRKRLTVCMVWLCRLLVGATFIVSGWAKSIDPWGFIYKLEEYFNVWSVYVPREITLALAIIVSVTEFAVGVMVLSGSMRRASVWVAASFMAVMLPLTVYVAIADPVADCGCFGEFIVLSNTATLIKNIVLTGLIIYLMAQNSRVGGIFVLGVQWLVLAGALCYALVLIFTGYRYQPLVDFRPYPIGTELTADALDEETSVDAESYIYMKDDEEKHFNVDNLPDSTWTFVRAEFEETATNSAPLTIYDGDDDVTESVLDGEGEQLILAVNDPGIHYLTRARLANELAHIIESRGGRMVGLVATDGERLMGWSQLALPEYPAYSVEDTSLKELVRGDAGLVYIVDGKIVWKRNLASVSHDVGRLLNSDDDFFSSNAGEEERFFYNMLTLGLITWLFLLAVVPRAFRRKTPASEKKRSET